MQNNTQVHLNLSIRVSHRELHDVEVMFVCLNTCVEYV